ncbi:MAG: Rrf2 family transcriptional regulator [Candidatus Omnitrophota bacterium]
MKISTRARYGTRLMLELGLHYGEGPVFLREIAKAEDISEKYLSQIIIPLKAVGLVNSFRGARGGYILARDPEEITVKEIVEVLEGGFTLVECINNSELCNRTSRCVTRKLWRDLGNQIAIMLGSVTLKELVIQCKSKNQDAMMYNI